MYDETGSPERLAMLVHYYREALAQDFGLPVSKNLEWNELSAGERHRLVAAVRLALLDMGLSRIQSGSGPIPPVAEFATGGSEGKECGS